MISAIIDCSHWNPEPDWAELRTGGIAAVLLKSTQGMSWVDPTFVTRVRDASAAGLLVGAYHFCDASKPAIQADHFLRVAGGLEVLALDVEPNGIGDTVSVAQAAEIASLVQAQVMRPPLVYMGRYGPSGNGAGLPNAVLARCPLWFADYSVTDQVLPAGWTDYTFWQFTNKATIAGCRGPVDQSRFVGSVEDLTVWWNPGP